MAAKQPSKLNPPAEWERFRRSPGLVLGFHGCDRKVGEDLLSGRIPHLKPSTNTYDWLGEGIYFWESDPWRALDFAEKAAAAKTAKVSKGKVNKPFVVGAVIDLGLCCNLLDWKSLGEVEAAYNFLQYAFEASGRELPENKGANFGARFLDRAVIEMLHTLRDSQDLAAYDSVRAAFREGSVLYEGAGFQRENHIQIAVRNTDCIKGYFRLPGF